MKQKKFQVVNARKRKRHNQNWRRNILMFLICTRNAHFQHTKRSQKKTENADQTMRDRFVTDRVNSPVSNQIRSFHSLRHASYIVVCCSAFHFGCKFLTFACVRAKALASVFHSSFTLACTRKEKNAQNRWFTIHRFNGCTTFIDSLRHLNSQHFVSRTNCLHFQCDFSFVKWFSETIPTTYDLASPITAEKNKAKIELWLRNVCRQSAANVTADELELEKKIVLFSMNERSQVAECRIKLTNNGKTSVQFKIINPTASGQTIWILNFL